MSSLQWSSIKTKVYNGHKRFKIYQNNYTELFLCTCTHTKKQQTVIIN